MVKTDQLLCVVIVIQAVGALWWWRGGIVANPEVGSPSVINDANSPEAMPRVTPTTKDDVAVECDFVAGGVEEHFTTGITEDWNGEKIVCQPWQGMGHMGIGW